MSRKLALLLTALAFVAGCKGKQQKSDVESTPLAPGVDSSIESSPMSFNAQGSDSGQIEGLVTINFEYDKSSLSADARRKLQGNADWMKKNSNVKVQIEGHCDNRGSLEYNLALGERRANAVRRHLISLGIPGSRLSTISYGKEKPLAGGEDESSHAQNRRANFVPLQ